MRPAHSTLSENIRAQSVGLLNKHTAAAIDLMPRRALAGACRAASERHDRIKIWVNEGSATGEVNR